MRGMLICTNFKQKRLKRSMYKKVLFPNICPLNVMSITWNCPVLDLHVRFKLTQTQILVFGLKGRTGGLWHGSQTKKNRGSQITDIKTLFS